MTVIDRLVEKIRTGKPIPAPIAVLLTAATPIPRIGMWMRRRKPRVRVNARVISFGNITAGGTGKTPAVIERARLEAAAGHTVGILTRGYGHTREGAPIVIARGKEAAGMGDVIGDEPALIARKVPEAYIARAANRIAAARELIDNHRCDTLILDDGFQYVQIERDENIALIDATNPFGNERLIPRGILREPITALARATHVVLTRCDQASEVDALVRRVRESCPNAPIRKTRHAPIRLRRVCDGREMALEDLKGMSVTVACAIGSPESFARTLSDLGARVAETIVNRDHGQLALDGESTNRILVTTEKDAARMKGAPEHVWALEIELKDI